MNCVPALMRAAKWRLWLTSLGCLLAIALTLLLMNIDFGGGNDYLGTVTVDVATMRKDMHAMLEQAALQQMSLWDVPDEKEERLLETLAMKQDLALAALDADWTTKTGLPAEAIETASIVRRAAEIDEQAVHDAAVRAGGAEGGSPPVRARPGKARGLRARRRDRADRGVGGADADRRLDGGQCRQPGACGRRGAGHRHRRRSRVGLAGEKVHLDAGLAGGAHRAIQFAVRHFFARAQALGYAEADPSFDIDGIDAAQKLTLLIAMAFGAELADIAVRAEK